KPQILAEAFHIAGIRARDQNISLAEIAGPQQTGADILRWNMLGIDQNLAVAISGNGGKRLIKTFAAPMPAELEAAESRQEIGASDDLPELRVIFLQVSPVISGFVVKGQRSPQVPGVKCSGQHGLQRLARRVRGSVHCSPQIGGNQNV